ncbi:MAG: class I SAM-dependent methyltransferase [bacterium]
MTDARIMEAPGIIDKDPMTPIWQDQRERWDGVARTMPDIFHTSSTQYYRRREIALLQRSFGPMKGKRVLKLDLWNEAVNTRILHWMKSQGAEAFGLDFSSVVTSRALQNSGETEGPLHLVQSDIRHIPFATNSFDFVYTMGTIEHIDEYQDAVDEVHRVLKVGGKTIIGVPHKWNIFLRPLLVNALDLFGKYPYSPEKSFSYGELRRVVEKCGLRVRNRTGIMAFPGILRMAELFLYKRKIPLYRLVRPILWPFDRLESRWEWPGLFGYLIALVAEKV